MCKPDFYFQGGRPEMLAFLPESYETVLEVGCGDGAFISALDGNSEKWGIEPGLIELCDKASSFHRFFRGDLSSVESQLPDGYFDLIICNDVIEHVEDTDLFLLTLKTKLSSNGVLVASIPNVRYCGNLVELLIGKDWRYRDEGILDVTHLRFFTKLSLSRTFRKNGYKLINVEGINSMKYGFSSKEQILQSIFCLIFGSDSKYMQYAVVAGAV